MAFAVRRRLLACSFLLLVASCNLPQPKVPSLNGTLVDGGRQTACSSPDPACHPLGRQSWRARGPRPYRAMTSSSRSWSRPCAVIPSRPVIVRPASSALTTAASVASTAA